MKKYFLMLVMMFTMAVYSFADNNDASVMKTNNIELNVKKFEMGINHRRLACVLGMSIDQMESTEAVIKQLQDNMALAGELKNEESSNRMVANAVKVNLKHMHYLLNEEQYRKYVMLLNLTLMNKGFEIAEITK